MFEQEHSKLVLERNMLKLELRDIRHSWVPELNDMNYIRHSWVLELNDMNYIRHSWVPGLNDMNYIRHSWALEQR